MSKFTRICCILLLLILALGAAFGTDYAFRTAEEISHPREYSDLITTYATRYNIPEYVVYAVIKVESNFDPKAESSVGARGLMQMMPSTFKWLTGNEHLKENLSEDKLFTPDVSIRYGCYYLQYLYAKFDHKWDLVFAAYNGGEGNVAKWLKNPEYADGNGNLKEIPFTETRNYVKKVNSAIKMYKKL
jgi:soluble lytic murein transglycosylase